MAGSSEQFAFYAARIEHANARSDAVSKHWGHGYLRALTRIIGRPPPAVYVVVSPGRGQAHRWSDAFDFERIPVEEQGSEEDRRLTAEIVAEIAIDPTKLVYGWWL